MNIRLGFVLGLLLTCAVLVALYVIIIQQDIRPPDALQALTTPTHVTLYSLEPSVSHGKGLRFHGYLILGMRILDDIQAVEAAKTFKDAVPLQGNGFTRVVSNCVFQPRHALRVVANGHIYDFLLCYHCEQLQIYRDDKQIAFLHASGSPDALNKLMRTEEAPHSPSIAP